MDYKQTASKIIDLVGGEKKYNQFDSLYH